MENYELLLTAQGEENISETIECLVEAVEEISKASESDFNTIKNKKWYNRLWEMVTFSKDNQKIQARGVANLAKLTEIVMKTIVLVSKQGAETSDLLSQAIKKTEGNLEKIECLTNNQVKIVNAIKELKWGYKERLSVTDLSVEKRNAMSAVFSKYIKNINEDIAENEFAQRIYGLIYSSSAPADVDYSILDSFNDNETILLYRLIQSYYYVATNQFDDDSEILDFLRISRKDEKIIKTDIQDTIKYLGKENYISAFDDGFDYRFVEDDSVEWEEITGAFEEEQTPNFVIFEDITISSMTHIAEGETLEYRNKNIKIESLIQCCGTLVFENCNITYNVSNELLSKFINSTSNKKGEIILENSAVLFSKNCSFTCESKTEKFFINAKSGSCISFENCKFNDCTYFIGDRAKEFLLVNSEIYNCAESFVKLHFYNDYKKCCIEGNTVIEELLSSYNKTTDFMTLFYIHIAYDVNMECSIVNNSIIQREEFRKDLGENAAYIYFNLHNGSISNCTFIGAERCIDDCINISNCIFKNCIKPVSVRTYDHNAKINNCLFQSCSYSISIDSNTTVSGCKFIDCNGMLINGNSAYEGGGKIEFCEILDYKTSGSGIVLTRSKKSSSSSNSIQNCIFDGCDLSGYLISSNCAEKPYDTVAYVQNCEFRNYDGKLIKETDSYMGIFNEVSYTAIKTSGCIGVGDARCINPVCDVSTKEAALAFAEKIGASINR